MGRWGWLLLLAAVAAPAVSARARQSELVVLKDGTILEGQVIESSARAVALTTDLEDPSSQRLIPRDTISRIVRVNDKGDLMPLGAATSQPERTWGVPPDPVAPPVMNRPAGPTYCRVPLRGDVGLTITARVLDRSLADAFARGPTVVVLDIDSPGGLIDEAGEIIRVLRRYGPQLRIVALAGQDLSAAAIITMSVKEIYIRPTGTIGAATAYSTALSGMPKDVAEKVQSAWRAVARSSAEQGGHNPLLAEAMIDSSLALHLATVDGKKVVRQGNGPQMLVRKGSVLALTAQEAVGCGLALGVADDFAELGKALGLAGWTECPGLGALLAEHQAKRIEALSAEMKKIGERFGDHLAEAIKADPSSGAYLQQIITRVPGSPIMMPQAPMVPTMPYVAPTIPQPGVRYGPDGMGRQGVGPSLPQPGPYVPRPGPYVPQPGPYVPQPGPYVPQPGPYIPQPGPYVRPPGHYVPVNPDVITTRTVQVVPEKTRAEWHGRSLRCVLALHQVEQDLDEAIALCRVFEQAAEGEMLGTLKESVRHTRVGVFRSRYRYVTSPAQTRAPYLADRRVDPRGPRVRDSAFDPRSIRLKLLEAKMQTSTVGQPAVLLVGIRNPVSDYQLDPRLPGPAFTILIFDDSDLAVYRGNVTIPEPIPSDKVGMFKVDLTHDEGGGPAQRPLMFAKPGRYRVFVNLFPGGDWSRPVDTVLFTFDINPKPGPGEGDGK